MTCWILESQRGAPGIAPCRSPLPRRRARGLPGGRYGVGGDAASGGAKWRPATGQELTEVASDRHGPHALPAQVGHGAGGRSRRVKPAASPGCATAWPVTVFGGSGSHVQEPSGAAGSDAGRSSGTGSSDCVMNSVIRSRANGGSPGTSAASLWTIDRAHGSSAARSPLRLP